MILIRNCPHDNGIYTLIDRVEGLVVKSSCTDNGIASLSREYAGYQWYLQQKNLLDTTLLRLVKNEYNSYCKLYIKLFSGREGKYYRNLSYNQGDLFKAISAYTKVWQRQKGQLAPLHGDFSLGNLIICGDEVIIIDWEHFQLDAAPWGFDLVNLIYESAFFSFKGKNTLNLRDSKVFFDLRRAVCDLLSPNEGFNCTLENLTQFVSSHLSVWGGLVNKLPVMKFTIAQEEYLKRLEL